jgi:hypothetical protein
VQLVEHELPDLVLWRRPPDVRLPLLLLLLLLPPPLALPPPAAA